MIKTKEVRAREKKKRQLRRRARRQEEVWSSEVWRSNLERDPFFSVNVAVPVGLRAVQGAILTLLVFYAVIVAKSAAAGRSEP